MSKINFSIIHPSWRQTVMSAFDTVDPNYIDYLQTDTHWLPGTERIFNAFTLPIDQTKYILFGESPYPRPQSANGCAFWDAAVDGLWSNQGLSKTVNRATSLRNIIKMLLIAAGYLSLSDTSQPAIAALDKAALVSSADELFGNFQRSGILLLNASLVLSQNHVKQDALAWRPFIDTLLTILTRSRPEIELILLGNIAKNINSLASAKYFKQFHAEHPYNLSFVTNSRVIAFFKPFRLLSKNGGLNL